MLSESPKSENNLKACKELCIYLKPSGNTDAPLFSAEKKSEINNCKDFRQFIDTVNQHLSWDEYSILSEIIEQRSSDKAEKELMQYKRKMDLSKALKIISSTKSDPPPGFERFYVIIKKPYKKLLTLEKYEEIKKNVLDNLNVCRYVITGYIGVLFDSLQLEWHVTKQTIPHMIEMAHMQKDFFVKKNFVFMQIGKEIIFDMYSEQMPVRLRVCILMIKRLSCFSIIKHA